MKYIDFKRYKLSKIFKNFNFKRYNLPDIFNFTIFKRRALSLFSKIIIFFDFKRYNYKRLIHHFFAFLKKFFLLPLIRLVKLKTYRQNLIYTASFLIFLVLVYLNIPLFFNYDKSKVESTICKTIKVDCVIKGKIKYSFFPSPRFKISNFIIKDFTDKSKTFGNVETLNVKIPFSNLHKKKFLFDEINLINYEININLQKLKQYNKFLKDKVLSYPIYFNNGKINFYDNDKYLTAFRNTKIKILSSKNVDEIILKGSFLEDMIYINFKNKKIEQISSKIITAKLPGYKLTGKANLINSNSKDLRGDFSFKKEKNKLTGIYTFNQNNLIISKANLANDFLEGELIGNLTFHPYFNFNLDVNLSGLNFNSLYNYLTSLDDVEKKNLFNVNKKLNGKINLSSEKIYSKFDLIDSFESQIQFVNGSIFIDRMLLNLGKLGAADLNGIVKNSEKFSNFKFENNIFIDNQKYFYRKFGIFNKRDISSNLFISGNFDLRNLRLLIDEISTENKMPQADIDFIQNEFNNMLLEDGYASLLSFLKLKEFVKLVLMERN